MPDKLKIYDLLLHTIIITNTNLSRIIRTEH